MALANACAIAVQTLIREKLWGNLKKVLRKKMYDEIRSFDSDSRVGNLIAS
jgi:hypothetical protein